MTSASDIAFASALDLVELYRTQALSPVEAAEALLDRARGAAAEAQRVLRHRPRRRAGRGARRRAALARRRAARAARRRAGDDQGPRADARVSDPARLAHDRSGPGCRGRAGGGAAARGRGGDPRQDDDPGIRLEGDRRLPADRHHPQPVEPRRARRAAAAPAPPPPAPPASRRCMSAATAPARSASRRAFTGIFGIKATFGRVPALSGLADGAVVECRADDAQRARRGADAERAGAARPPRPVCAAARAPDVSRRDRGRRARLAHRLQPRSRLCQGRSRDRRLRCAEAAQRFEELGAHVEQVGADLRLAAPGAADPVGGRRRARAWPRFPDDKRASAPIPG